MPTWEDVEHFQGSRLYELAKADLLISHSQPPLVCAALQPCNIALTGVGKPGQCIEDT